MVADWLAGTAHDYQGNAQGVAVQLAAMTFDDGEQPPAAPAVTVDSRDGNAARGDYPSGTSGLQIRLTELRLEAGVYSQTEGHGTAQVLIRYLASNEVSADGLRDGANMMRAVVRSLRRLHGPGEANNGRKRNNVAILPSATEPIQVLRVEAAREDDDVLTGCLVTYDVMELNP
jgi:hypothetical protein